MSIVPQVGMVELLVLGILALIIVGPNDLPKLMRRAGQAAGKVRAMADDFRRSFDEMAREAEMEDLRKEIEALKAANPAKAMKDAVDDIDSAVATPAPAKTDPVPTATGPKATQE